MTILNITKQLAWIAFLLAGAFAFYELAGFLQLYQDIIRAIASTSVGAGA